MSEEPYQGNSKKLTRRQFVKRALGTSLVAGVGALGYTHFVEPHWIEVVKRSLPIKNLPTPLVGKCLIQISDLHVGDAMDTKYLKAALESLVDFNPDLIVITGDFMTCNEVEQIGPVGEVMSHLPEPPLGTVAILGNHDYGLGWRQANAAKELTSCVSDLGIRMLRNQVIDIAGLQIAGIDDLWSRFALPKQTMAEIDPARASLVLCHNPDVVDKPVWENYHGWILAGHTHGGQCTVPFYGPIILPVKNRRYTSGEFELSGDRRLYINRGLGYSTRLRFNCRPEITVFTLENDLTVAASDLAKVETTA